MLPLVLMFALVFTDCVNGRRVLPPLRMKDDCFVVDPEVGKFRMEDEAVILAFPTFLRALQLRRIASPTGTFSIARSNETGGVAIGGEGRVQQHDKELWLLPAQASDSGEYICTYRGDICLFSFVPPQGGQRNETYCVRGSITLHVYESNSVDMQKLSYPISAVLGENLPIECPFLSEFNQTDHIEWYKDYSPSALRLGVVGSEVVIPSVQRRHQGLYTCRFTVHIDSQTYKVSRNVQLNVRVPAVDLLTSRPTVDLSVTSEPSLSHSTVDVILPPVIISPLNGSIFESAHGSGLELFCKVQTECRTADSTVVTWLVNDQSVESSYLDGRALQGGRRVTRVLGGCQMELRLVVIAIREEDTKTELKCVAQNQGGRQEAVAQLRLEDTMFTWLVVGLVALSCILSVLSVFLYVLLKPKSKADYILARQNSTL